LYGSTIAMTWPAAHTHALTSVALTPHSSSGSAPNSPRKRRPCSSPLNLAAAPDENLGAEGCGEYGGIFPLHPVGGGYTSSKGWVPGGKPGVRKGGAATASNLHRNMLDRSLANKRVKKEQFDIVDADFL